MKFLLLLYGDETKWMNMSPEEAQQSVEVWNAFSNALVDAGAMVSGEALAPTTDATTVRIAQQEIVRTDGPFAETREQLGGFYVIECKDIDEAATWAAKVPELADHGSVEVRPVIDYEAAGSDQQPSAEARQA
jgi:hypothetical protein